MSQGMFTWNDGTLSDQLRDLGIRQADDHADPEWKDAALLAVHRCAVSHPEFIVDSVWQFIPEGFTTREGRAMGAVIRKALERQWIEPTGRYTKTARTTSHSAPRQIWRSLVYGKSK